MPMSAEAAAGLRAAVEYNPHAARYFMHILRDLPIGVRYKKQDRYGPLSMMLSAIKPVKSITKNVSIPFKPEPLSEEQLNACETFNAEWLQHRFTKQELADEIENILAEVTTPPLLETVDTNTFLVFTANGTFLQKNGEKQEPFKK